MTSASFELKLNRKKAASATLRDAMYSVLRTSGVSTIVPWYVGKTVTSFDSECFQPHKRVIYAKAISYYKRAVPHLFLISRLTIGGSFYKGASAVSTNFLERHLISLGLQANSDLLNKRDTKLYREVHLRGILNSEGGKPDKAAKELRLSLSFIVYLVSVNCGR